MKIDGEGFIVNDEGEQILNGTEPMKASEIDGFKSQNDINAVAGKLRSELADQKAMVETLKSAGANADAQVRKVAELEILLAQTSEQAKAQADADAQAKFTKQLDKANSERGEWEKKYRAEAQLRTDTTINNALLGAASDLGFLRSADALQLRDRAKLEPVLDDQGNPTGAMELSFEIETTKDDEAVKEFVQAKEAAQWLAAANPHYVKSNPAGGPDGNGRFGPAGPFQNIRYGSDFTSDQQRVEYVEAHGQEKYLEVCRSVRPAAPA